MRWSRFRDDDDLIAELRALRPTPRPSSPPSSTSAPPRASRGARRARLAAGRLPRRLRALPPRRLVAPGGAAALAAIVIATVVVAAQRAADRARRTGPARPARARSRDGRLLADPSRRSGSFRRTPSRARARAQSSSAGRRQQPTRAPRSPRLRPQHRPLRRAGAGHRDVERSAEIVLGADPAESRDDAAKVFDAVHAADGIVLSSSVSDGAAGEAGASFDLLIPSAKLGDALAAFSAIDEVVSRHEATDDITAPTVGVGEHLQDSRATDRRPARPARRRRHRRRAGSGRSRAARRAPPRRRACARSSTELQRRANLSRVSLRIETGAGATSTERRRQPGASATPSTTPATSSASPPASPSSASRSSPRSP